MTSSVLLRKTLLSVLQEELLPELKRSSTPRLASAGLPHRFGDGFLVREMEFPPLEEADATQVYPEGQKWDEFHLHALNCPTLHCIIEGEADILIGVTAEMLSRVAASKRPANPRGGYMVSVVAPAYLLVPSGVPKRTGDGPPWDREQAHSGTLRILTVRVLPIGALCHLTSLENGEFNVGYSLLIRDERLLSFLDVLIDETTVPEPHPLILHAQLLALMLRLERGLNTQFPLVTDGLYSRFPESKPTNLQEQQTHHPIIERAHNFIQLRLHEPLSPAHIARHVRLTPTQLNRLFRTHTGMSTMGYVTSLRMETAQLLLRTSDLSVQEICRLVGYRRLQHFSYAFRQHTGESPLKFRQQAGDETIN